MMAKKHERLHVLLSSKHLSLKLRAQLASMNDDQLSDAIDAIDKWLASKEENKHSSGVRTKADK